MPSGTPPASREGSTISVLTSPAKDPGGNDSEQRPKVDTHVRLANFRAKVQALGRKTNNAFDAITDLIAEARINKASLMDSRQAPRELVKLLSLPLAQRRATTYRDLCEIGRNVELPHWHGTDRRQLYVWYHCCQRLKLVEMEEGQCVTREGELGDFTYWLLTGAMEEVPPPPPSPPPASPPKGTRVTPRPHGAAAGETGSGGGAGPGAPTDAHAAHATASHAAAAAHATAARAAVHAVDANGAGNPGSSGGDSAGGAAAAAPPPQQQPPKLARPKTAALSVSLTGRVMTPPVGMADAPVRQTARSIRVFERVGHEALMVNPYAATVKTTRKCQLAALSRADYQAVVAAAAQKSFEGLKAMSCLLANRSSRHPSVLADLASLLSVTDLFQAIDPEFRPELCGLAEFLALPEGVVLFEEGDKVDFSYIILKGEVALSRYNDSRKALEDIAVVTTGQHFGTLTPQAIAAAAGSSVVAGSQGGSGAGGIGVGGGPGASVGGGGFDKKRTFSARCTQPTEFAIVSKLGYQRLIKNQLQKSIAVRLKVLQGMAIMKSASTQNSLSRIAYLCQDETFSAGASVVDPANPPSRLFFIVEGQAKLLWVADSPTQVPPPVDRLIVDRPGPAGSGQGGTAATSSTSAAGSAAAGGDRGSGAAGGSTSAGGAAVASSQSGEVALGAGAGGGAGSGAGGGGRGIKKRQQPYVYELALLSRGDVVNGVILHGRASCFTVVAATTLKVMSLELSGGAAALEQLFGREQAASLRDLVLRQAEVHRERAAHMVTVRQSSAALLGDRGLPPTPMPDSHLAASFMAHYVPKTPGAEAGPSLPLMGYAAAVADLSLFVPGAVQHGDVMKLVTAAGQSVIDCALPSRAGAPAAAAAAAAAAAGASAAVGDYSPGASSPSAGSALALLQQQQRGPEHRMARGDAAHVTTVVAQPVPIPRTRMRVPSVGMARELGLEAPPPAQMPPSLVGELSSLAVLPDPAGGKSRNGRPRARHRTQLGLPFAGNVAMLVLENHSHLVKVVSPGPSSIDAINALRKANSASCLNVAGGGGSYYSDGDDGRYGSEGPSLTVVLPELRTSVAATTVTPSANAAAAAAAAASDADMLGGDGAEADDEAEEDDDGAGGASSVAGSPDWSGVAAEAEASSRSAQAAAMGDISVVNSATVDVERIVLPPSAEGAESSAGELWTGAWAGGGSGDGAAADGVRSAATSQNGDGSVAEVPWRYTRPSPQSHSFTMASPPSMLYGQGSSAAVYGQGSSLSYVEPLTLAASQSASQLHYQGQGHGLPHLLQTPVVQHSTTSLGPSQSLQATVTPSPPRHLMATTTAAGNMAAPPGTPLVAGQAHVPPSLPYLRAAPAPGTPGTAGALSSPALIKTAVVQPVSSEVTAKLTANRLTTIMSAGPMAAGDASASAASAAAGGGSSFFPPAMPSPRSATAPAVEASPTLASVHVHRSQSQPRQQPADALAAAAPTSPNHQENVIILPRMVFYEGAVFDNAVNSPRCTVRLATVGAATAAAAAGGMATSSGSAPSSPRGGGGSFRPAGAASPRGSNGFPLPPMPGRMQSSPTAPGVGSPHATYALPAIPGSASASASGLAQDAASAQNNEQPQFAGPQLPPQGRISPSRFRATDLSPAYQFGVSRDLLGYYSSRGGTPGGDGLVFTGGIGGRVARNGGGGANRQRGDGGGQRRYGGVSLRDIAGVNGLPRRNRGRMGSSGNGALKQPCDGPELPLEIDTEAPPLQNHKLSEPSLNDLRYILSRWSTKWAQERCELHVVSRLGKRGDNTPAGASSYPGTGASGPAANFRAFQVPARNGTGAAAVRLGTPVELSQFGYSLDDMESVLGSRVAAAAATAAAAAGSSGRRAPVVADAVGVGAFKRPLAQLGLFGVPYVGGTPRSSGATGEGTVA